ncbi:hypothetical protein QBC41DRAFT_71344 [Cercophora samala]|uniref:Uncharacterized protein n=1 Tax=Cercophora samala TaxID=330535 RepID=A0AA39ZMY9_9PEZI|nr:hypothetical protein QBC41DRAFT_71344 [Cercophora samala]
MPSGLSKRGRRSISYFRQWFGVPVWQNLVRIHREHRPWGGGLLLILLFYFFGFVLLFTDRISPLFCFILFVLDLVAIAHITFWTAYYPLIFCHCFFIRIDTTPFFTSIIIAILAIFTQPSIFVRCNGRFTNSSTSPLHITDTQLPHITLQHPNSSPLFCPPPTHTITHYLPRPRF